MTINAKGNTDICESTCAEINYFLMETLSRHLTNGSSGPDFTC